MCEKAGYDLHVACNCPPACAATAACNQGGAGSGPRLPLCAAVLHVLHYAQGSDGSASKENPHQTPAPPPQCSLHEEIPTHLPLCAAVLHILHIHQAAQQLRLQQAELQDSVGVCGKDADDSSQQPMAPIGRE